MTTETDKPGDNNARLKRAYGKKTTEDSRKLFDAWAPTYDNELIHDLGYAGPREACKVLDSLVPDRSARILDAGCGTGLVGDELIAAGYKDIHGYDIAGEMLAIARERRIYVSLLEHDATQAFEADPLYDAAICVGMFGFGPPYPADLRHVVNAVRPGGPVVCTINGRGWVEKNWSEVLPQEAERHGFMVEQILEIPYLQKEGIDGRILVLRGNG